MKHKHCTDVESRPVDIEGAAGCRVRWLIGSDDGAPNFAMRQFEVQPGGRRPRHAHPFEHEVYVLSGSGVAVEGDTEHPLRQGDFVYVAPDELHQFRNTGSEPMLFLCLVPHGL